MLFPRLHRLVPAPFIACWLAANPAQARDDLAPAVSSSTSLLPQAAESVPESSVHAHTASRYRLVEEYTAAVLDDGEVKLGTDAEYGLSSTLMIGADLVAGAVGAPSLQGKYLLWQNAEHQLAIGFRLAYLNRATLLWGNVNEHFDELDARIIRPQIAWTNLLSPRLKLHTFWAKGFGKIKATLSDKGRRKLWETKHPGADYDKRDAMTKQPETSKEKVETETREEAPGSGENQESTRQSSLTQQSIQVQSITGLAQERFQLTGEFTRKNGNKILVTSRIEQSEFERMKSNFFRLTTAHQWIWTNFQMRLGIGVQYYVMSGRDLDGEQIDAAGVQPASDIGFYWRF